MHSRRSMRTFDGCRHGSFHGIIKSLVLGRDFGLFHGHFSIIMWRWSRCEGHEVGTRHESEKRILSQIVAIDSSFEEMTRGNRR